MNIPRDQFPPVLVDDTKAFVDWLCKDGVPVETRMVDPGQLKPIQSHVNQSKIDGMIEADKAGTLDVAEKNVMVSSDDYLIDYHHRAVAADQFGKPMTATVIGLPAKELIEKRPESS